MSLLTRYVLMRGEDDADELNHHIVTIILPTLTYALNNDINPPHHPTFTCPFDIQEEFSNNDEGYRYKLFLVFFLLWLNKDYIQYMMAGETQTKIDLFMNKLDKSMNCWLKGYDQSYRIWPWINKAQYKKKNILSKTSYTVDVLVNHLIHYLLLL